MRAARATLRQAFAAACLASVLGACASSAPPAGAGSPSADGQRPADASALLEGAAVVTSYAGQWRILYRTRPDAIPLNEPFDVEVVVLDAAGRPADDVALVVDASMPRHRHGMNRQPLLEREPGGRFRAAGLLFHMPGSWTLTFDVTRDGITERAEAVVILDG